jgi:predicted alpha-1,2-mannosidase
MSDLSTKIFLCAGLLPLMAACHEQQPDAGYAGYVDPFIGTAYVGHTHPAAQLPFGMVQAGPDTGTDTWEHCSGYYDRDSSIIGFSHTHLSGTGCPDMGDIMCMPVVGNPGFSSGDKGDTYSGYRSAFSHESEVAQPGYYKVRLDDDGVVAELTATTCVGFHRYAYPESEKPAGIIFDMAHGIGDTATATSLRLLNDSVLIGKRRSTGFVADHTWYFCAKFSTPVVDLLSFADGNTSTNRNLHGKATKMLLHFGHTDEVMVKVALSTVSEEGAMKNMEAEIPGWDFDGVRGDATEKWNEYLSKIDMAPLHDEQRISFYTSLYHTLLMPNIVTDVDGVYRLPNGQLMENNRTDKYTNFSLWDTYRATHPFYSILYPTANVRFVESMLELFRERGVLCTNEYGQNETWCMIGNHAVPVIADAYLKGLAKENAGFAAEAIYKSLTVSHEKSYWDVYDKYGYYPFDLIPSESVSRTMEHCYDDYCAALMAGLLSDTAKQSFFSSRAENFRHLFDDETKLMRAKDSKGRWRSPFDRFLLSHESTSGGDYTEGNAWQYTWHVQHNIPALVEMIGGEEAFGLKLDSLFFLDARSEGGGFHGDVTGMIGQYAHGNEPSHHVAYLYGYSDKPHKTQELVRKIFDDFYFPRRDGLSGNDDCGQMSAWYIFSALGFYPVDPVSGEYIIGAPQMPSVTLHLPNGKDFVMVARNLSEENKYVRSITLNGRPLEGFAITWDDIMEGGTIAFDMAPEPVFRKPG